MYQTIHWKCVKIVDIQTFNIQKSSLHNDSCKESISDLKENKLLSL